MKLKDMKEKHDHKFTDLLKVGIFALLMIAPLFASVSQMLYATFNKNAHESYYGQTINDSKNVYYSVNELQINEKYNFTASNILYENRPSNSYINVDNFVAHSNVDNNGATFDISEVNRILFWVPSNMYLGFEFYKQGENGYYYINTQNTTVDFTFTLLNNGLNSDISANLNNVFYQIQYNKDSYLDNAFYYGVDQMTKSDLFNWTQNTAIYTGVKAMTDNLQIQTPAIAILIVYWFILTIIYIIIDIVIKCFTAITHLI